MKLGSEIQGQQIAQRQIQSGHDENETGHAVTANAQRPKKSSNRTKIIGHGRPQAAQKGGAERDAAAETALGRRPAMTDGALGRM